MKIGFFDSGLGGLTILKAVVKKMPTYDYLYFGDTKNLPYGDRSEEEICTLTKEGVRYLFDNECLLVVVACNSASVETARRLQDEFLTEEFPDKKLLAILIPTIEELKYNNKTEVALLATKRTVESARYENEITLRENSNVSLISLPTPELVPLIELNEIETAGQQAIRKIEEEAGESSVVVLGCSHYSMIKSNLRTHFGDSKQIISQDEIIPKKLKIYLSNHPEIESRLSREGERTVHLTEHRPDYDLIMGHFLGGVYTADEEQG